MLEQYYRRSLVPIREGGAGAGEVGGGMDRGGESGDNARPMTQTHTSPPRPALEVVGLIPAAGQAKTVAAVPLQQGSLSCRLRPRREDRAAASESRSPLFTGKIPGRRNHEGLLRDQRRQMGYSELFSRGRPGRSVAGLSRDRRIAGAAGYHRSRLSVYRTETRGVWLSGYSIRADDAYGS
jgi:hypothetical protein